MQQESWIHSDIQGVTRRRLRLVPWTFASESYRFVSRTRIRLDETVIDAIFRDIDQSHLPGAAVGIAVGGVPVYGRGFGLASMAMPDALTTQTKMRVYSITKHLTCLAYLLLCEEGKAGIEDPVAKYLPELHPSTHRVTMRHLMSNTSGLRDACDIRWFFSGIERTVCSRDILEMYRDIADVNFPPGNAWCYNNGGFHILSAVIERIEDQRLEDIFRRRLFEPAGLRDTSLRRLDADSVEPNSAGMHMLRPGNTFEKTCLPGELAGEGGVVSTIDDMLRWMKNIASPIVATSESWALLTASHQLDDGAKTGYGLGLFRHPYRGLDTISHSGGGLGSNAQMVRVPEFELDVIVLVNRSDVSSAELVGSIIDACLGSALEPPRFPTGYVTGLFRSSTTGQVVQLSKRDKRQLIALDGGEEMEMVPVRDHALGLAHHRLSNCAIGWDGDAAEPDLIRYECFGVTERLFAQPAGTKQELGTITGNYSSEDIGIEVTITSDSEGGCLVTKGKFGSRRYVLEGIGGDLWRIRSRDRTPWSGTLAAASGGHELLLQTPNTRRVHLRRTS